MTLNEFSNTFGPALTAIGVDYFVDFELGIIRFGVMSFVEKEIEYAPAVARGLLVAWAAERGRAVITADTMTSGHSWWQMQHQTGVPVCDDEELYAEYDDALIAGYIALAPDAASEESKKGYDHFGEPRDGAAS